MTRDDILLAFIREFSVLGTQIGKAISTADRREQCRVAICQARKQNVELERGTTYGQAFRIAFGESIERRSRDRAPALQTGGIEDFDEAEDAEADSALDDDQT